MKCIVAIILGLTAVQVDGAPRGSSTGDDCSPPPNHLEPRQFEYVREGGGGGGGADVNDIGGGVGGALFPGGLPIGLPGSIDSGIDNNFPRPAKDVPGPGGGGGIDFLGSPPFPGGPLSGLPGVIGGGNGNNLPQSGPAKDVLSSSDGDDGTGFLDGSPLPGGPLGGLPIGIGGVPPNGPANGVSSGSPGSVDNGSGFKGDSPRGRLPHNELPESDEPQDGVPNTGGQPSNAVPPNGRLTGNQPVNGPSEDRTGQTSSQSPQNGPSNDQLHASQPKDRGPGDDLPSETQPQEKQPPQEPPQTAEPTNSQPVKKPGNGQPNSGGDLAPCGNLQAVQSAAIAWRNRTAIVSSFLSRAVSLGPGRLADEAALALVAENEEVPFKAVLDRHCRPEALVAANATLEGQGTFRRAVDSLGRLARSGNSMSAAQVKEQVDKTARGRCQDVLPSIDRYLTVAGIQARAVRPRQCEAGLADERRLA
ncbi:Glutamine-rich protein 2 [Purpureocillium lilacinum]|uniref:Glutamine-rich protein 2 n=1 Tax=Purpureocillium lilacinum TaxID=33203 RepID=UPI00207DA740|nr:Glutamine-rich protein 2 [Purpureocillium lilacinum]